MMGRSDGARRDLPGGAQVFGSAFAVLVVAVSAANWAGVLVAALITVAAIGVCVALFAGFNGRRWDRRKTALVAVSSATALILVGVAAVAGGSGRRGAKVAEDAEPAPVLSSSSYRLAPSSSVFTNDQDKVDLDTGCPGRGPTRIQVGPSRCGENADLILDAGELVTWERMPRIALPDPGERASHATCRRLLTLSRMLGRIDVRRLDEGSQLCVLTDKGSSAAVRVEDVSMPSIVISFDVWTR